LIHVSGSSTRTFILLVLDSQSRSLVTSPASAVVTATFSKTLAQVAPPPPTACPRLIMLHSLRFEVPIVLLIERYLASSSLRFVDVGPSLSHQNSLLTSSFLMPSMCTHPNLLFTSSLLTHRLYAQQELSDGKFTRTGGANNECRMSPHVRGG